MTRIGGYEFSESARFQKDAPTDTAAARAVGEHLDLLRHQFKGELTPQDVLADARNPNSPLHPYFEWDDSEAAEQFRLQQARGLIRAVVAIYVHEDRPATPMKMFVHIPEPTAPHYRETSHAMSQKKTREMVLRRALNELKAWKQRYKDLEEFASLIRIIDTIDEDFPRSLEKIGVR